MNGSIPTNSNSPLILRLEHPGDRARCFSGLIELRGWLLLPETLAELRDSLRVEVLAEKHGARSMLGVGMAFCGEALDGVETATGLRLSSLELNTAPEQILDPGGMVAGETISVCAQVEASSELLSVDDTFKAFTLALRAEVAGKRVVSNFHTVIFEQGNRRDVARGELISPSTTILSADLLLVEGWVLRHADPLEEVVVSLGETSFGKALIKLKSPEQAALFPDISGADACRFSAVVSREQAQLAGISEETLRTGLELKVQCRFRSGETFQLGRPMLRWEEGLKTAHQARIEQLAITPAGALEIAGWVVNRYLEAPSWRLSWSRASLEFNGQEPGDALSFEKRPEIGARFPLYAGDEKLGFRIQLDAHALGSRPLAPSFSIRGPFADEYETIEPSALMAGMLQLCRIESGKPGEPFPGTAALNSGLGVGRSLLKAKREKRVAEGSAEEGFKRLLIASHNLSAMEGAPKVIGNLIRALRIELAPELEIILISPKDGALRADLEKLGVRVLVIPELELFQQHGERYLQGLREVRRLTSGFKPQVVLANVIDSFWAIDYAERYAIPAAWVIHESIDPRAWTGTLKPNLRQVFFHSLRHAARCIFVAQQTAELYRPFLSPESDVVIPNGIDHAAIVSRCASLSPEAARKELGLSDETVVTIVGTTTPRKGQDIFLRAMAELKARQANKAFRFYVVGAREIAYLEELRNLSRELSLQDELEFVPETPNIQHYYRASDVMVIASREESAPLVSLEAFAYGVPLVSTTVFGLAEQIRPEENALAFTVDCPKEAAAQVARLLDDSELRERITRNAGQDIIERFSLNVSMERFWDELQAVQRSTVRTLLDAE